MNYFYEAVDASGQTVLGKIEAVDEAEVQQKLLNLGYLPHSIAPTVASSVTPGTSMDVRLPTAAPAVEQTLVGTQIQRPVVARTQVMTQPPVQATIAPPINAQRTGTITFAGNAARLATRERRTERPRPGTQAPAGSDLAGVSTRDLLFFFQQLASLANSGMTVYAALDNLAPRTSNPSLSLTAHEMAQQAHQGGRISDVMARYPRIYAEHVVGMTRAAETGGYLWIAFAEIADGYDHPRNIALYRGSWVPKLMATQAALALALAQPLFPNLFPDGDFKRYILLAVGRNLPIVGALYLGILAAGRALNLPKNRLLRDGWALKLKPFGRLQRMTALNAFIRALRRLYAAGVSPDLAWEGAMNTASNLAIREKLVAADELLRQGRPISDAFISTGLFTDQVEQLIITGQASGEVVESLDKVAAYYDREIDDATGKARFAMMRMGVMAMLVLGGATMLWMAHSYFQGIFDYVDSNFAQ